MKTEKNQVILSGVVVKGPEFDHESFGEKFYKMFVSSERRSGVSDCIPVLASEYLLKGEKWDGKAIEVSGSFRSYNWHEGEKNRLLLNVFAENIEWWSGEDKNYIFLDGYICKKQDMRETPLGRQITDLLIAVNRERGKSDYIPCICWGRTAVYADKMPVGTHVNIEGRIQSREFTKKFEDGVQETRVAYEVSVKSIEDMSEGKDVE